MIKCKVCDKSFSAKSYGQLCNSCLKKCEKCQGKDRMISTLTKAVEQLRKRVEVLEGEKREADNFIFWR